ncbi:MAG: hypothetical protein JST40_10270 [Armatimonadetes bacterium]|nr:hypothetical protein [Armatimonadota bacterium]
MSLFVTTQDIRERCGLTVTDYDTEINRMVGQMLSAIQYEIADVHLGLDAPAGLASVLNLAALEIIAGEFYAQLLRKPGYADKVDLAGLSVQPFVGSDSKDPSGMIVRGWERLRPYRRNDPLVTPPASVSAANGKSEVQE